MTGEGFVDDDQRWRTDPRFHVVAADGWVYLEAGLVDGQEELWIGRVVAFLVQTDYDYREREPGALWKEWREGRDGKQKETWKSNDSSNRGVPLIYHPDEDGLNRLEPSWNTRIVGVCRLEDIPECLLERAHRLLAGADLERLTEMAFAELRRVESKP